MATVVITLKIMPDSPDVDISKLAQVASEKITAFGGNVGKTDIELIAFGLKAAVLMFALPEEKGSTEELENELAKLPSVSSVQVTDVRRTVG